MCLHIRIRYNHKINIKDVNTTSAKLINTLYKYIQLSVEITPPLKLMVSYTISILVLPCMPHGEDKAFQSPKAD